MKRSKITLQSGKTYTYSGTDGAYTVILGELAAGDAPASSGSAAPVIAADDGPPSSSLTGSITTYIDRASKKFYIRSSGSWDSGTSMTGSAGAAGPAGSSGTNGSNGSNGANGTDGKSVRFGNGAPSNLLGSNDEVYIDVSSFKIHTKSGGSWSAGSIFSGSRGLSGANGADGKSVRFGNGTPSNSDGVDDETYINLSDFKIHTKSGGSWSSGVVFSGSKGSNGSSGSNGSNGADGKSVRFGSGSPSNLLGSNDEIYIDVDSFKIHTKSAGSWSAGSAFKGDTGATGPQGIQGLTGLTGAGGAKGDTGTGLEIYTSGLDSTITLTAAGKNLYFTDVERNLGDLVTVSGNSTDGTTFTVASGKSGRYKLELSLGMKIDRSASSAFSVTSEVYLNGELLEDETYTSPTVSASTVYRTFTISTSAYLKAGDTLKFKAKRAINSDVVISLNAVNKSSTTIPDTIASIRKL
jgi:hypothetical protein